MSDQEHLSRALKSRHIQMIALGGAIGTGLFFGAGTAIRMTGPSIILAYALGGLMIYFVMRMLGEMSTQEPVAGAFSHFAYKYWGKFPGFVAGWNYWILYILVSMVELTVIGEYIRYWYPDFPPWLSALIVLVLITFINLVSVKIYGEFEFYFALLKIITIIFLIVLGAYIILFGFGGEPAGISNLWIHGGFMPNGLSGMASALVVVAFSFGGTELVGVAAGEADNPRETIPKAIKQVMLRILIFYIGSLAVIMCIYPWNEISTAENLSTSPFVLIFTKIGIPAAAHIMNFVVLSAAVSVYNSGIYSNGRMLYSLAEQGNAPQIFKKLNSSRIPVTAILFSSACTLVIVIVNFLVPDGAFMRIMTIATTSAIITWLLIVIVHLFFRKKMVEQREMIYFPSLLYPYANYIVILYFMFLMYIMWVIGKQEALIAIPLWIGVLAVGFWAKEKNAEKMLKD